MLNTATNTDPGTTFQQRLEWAAQHMPVSRALSARLPDLRGVRLACSIHLDLKMVAVLETLLTRGATLFLTTCNVTTVRDEVVAYLTDRGAVAHAWVGMGLRDVDEGVRRALAWHPSHTCEMGADLSIAAHTQTETTLETTLRAGLEATGSGISRLRGMPLRYPIFNWDDLPIKEGLHNRYLVGLSTWQTFCERTQLSLHGKRVLVVGYGLVGQGVAEAARAFGGVVSVAERDPTRTLMARYAGWPTGTLSDLAPQADVVVTATGVKGVLDAALLHTLKAGCFLLNVGHRADEIDLQALGTRRPVLPFVELCQLGNTPLYLFAGGSMANLTAGHGDSLNAFDLTLAVMVAGIGFITTLSSGSSSWPAGLYPLPDEVWLEVARQA